MSFLRRIFKNEPAEPELQAPPQPLPQRNDPCWCGSQKKYKKCHLEEDRQQLARIREKERAAKACSPAFG
ncbi:MAG: SEC-C domain-containing protein [Desulfuromonadales bacterium]|nr:SEC-C domain-containing protein [Desulfuromonadales bacterium]